MKQTDFIVTLFEGKENPNNLTVAVVKSLSRTSLGLLGAVCVTIKQIIGAKENENQI